MSQLALFADPAVTGTCPDCDRELRDVFTPGTPPPEPWDQGQDWTHGAIWKVCDCSPTTPRACVPAPDPRTVAP